MLMKRNGKAKRKYEMSARSPISELCQPYEEIRMLTNMNAMAKRQKHWKKTKPAKLLSLKATAQEIIPTITTAGPGIIDVCTAKGL
jgi:hypothetical protein